MSEVTKRIFASDVFIQEGVSPAQDILIVACTVGDDSDNPDNRIALKKEELWLNFGFEGESVLSVDATKDGKAYVLGEEGTIIQFNWKMPKTNDELLASMDFFENNVVETPLRRLRIIGNEVFCGGSCGQMYRFKKGKFYALPRLIIDGEEQTVEDISGTNTDDLIVVTSEGSGAWFDGSAWYLLDLPTNISLTSICTLGEGRYAIAGYNGTILIGKKSRWQVVEDTDSERIYWGIAYSREMLYAAHSGGIDIISEKKISPLKIPKMKDPEFCVLRSGPDGLWSCSGHTIGLITADGWQTIAK